MTRLVYAMTGALIALVPITALAATPSPSLETVLAQPPGSDFTELTTATFHGRFTAHDWASNSIGATAAETESTLNRYGFVDGYGLEWASTSARRALVEIVMAFGGGQGARKTLTALEAADKRDPHYQHATTLSGIDPSYGVHAFDSSTGVYTDGFSFVKGNDVFQVYFASIKDDNLAPATSQAKLQYDSAPDSTIPSSQWPENASRIPSSAYQAGVTSFWVLMILGGIAVVAALVIRSRRRASVPVYGAVQLSPDGRYWYDGQGWRDASQEVPPTAQRSADGTLWWDGRTWRPVPQPAQPPQSPPTS